MDRSKKKIHEYKTIIGSSSGEYKEKGSKFIAFAYHIESRDDIKPILENLRSLHFKARHHCFAFRLGIDENDYRANDDGEPSGTAGLPILGQIDSFELTNLIIIVVRYFGGTKLGVPGLIRAYKTAAEESLINAQVIIKKIKIRYKFTFGYDMMNFIMKHTKSGDIEIIEQIFEGENASITVDIPISIASIIIEKMEEGLRIIQAEKNVKIEKIKEII